MKKKSIHVLPAIKLSKMVFNLILGFNAGNIKYKCMSIFCLNLLNEYKCIFYKKSKLYQKGVIWGVNFTRLWIILDSYKTVNILL